MKAEALDVFGGSEGTNDVDIGAGPKMVEERRTPGKRLCIQDENGKMFLLHINPDEEGKIYSCPDGQAYSPASCVYC